MQGYSYSIFSTVAIAIHLIINFDLMVGRGLDSVRGTRYRGFLFGILAYYLTDAAWGLFAGLGWIGAWYVDTVLFFLSLVAFVLMWCRFVVRYLDLGKWPTRILAWSGYALLAVNVVSLSANPFNGCFFSIDTQGCYHTGFMRDPAFALLVAFSALVAVCTLAKALGSRDAVRRRSMMVFLTSIVMAVSIVLQVVWPLTPFTALGCLICNCFVHVFVIQDEQAAKHMAELEEALGRVRAAEKARSMFFNIVSRDIRTPLNAILGYSEALQFEANSQDEKDEALKAIRANGMTLLQLVNDVIDLANMDSGYMNFRPEPVRPSRLTDIVIASFRATASAKGLELVNRISGVPTVLLDEHRFRQILFNLIGNSIKFASHGTVTVGASYAGTKLEVVVSDDGGGVSQETLARILDPFVESEDVGHAVADRSGGIGLGLSICKRLVETMGGDLAVKSELGSGSTFKVRIPCVAIGADTAYDPPPSAAEAPGADRPS